MTMFDQGSGPPVVVVQGVHGRWEWTAPALRWWIERTDWVFRVTLNHGFRAIEAYGMALAILPVLLAILAGWALEQLERARTEAV